MKREHEINGELPTEYQKVEYLESTGTQYINTGYVPNSNTSLYIDAQFLNTSPKNLCDVRWSQAPRYDTFGIYCGIGQGLIYYLGNTNNNEAYTYTSFNHSTNRFNAGIDADGCWFNGTLVSNKHVGSISTTYELPLFAFSNNGINCGEGIRIFECLMAETDSMRHFVPVVRKSDNKPGMYDLCGSICPLTGTPFYINAGTGEFLYK